MKKNPKKKELKTNKTRKVSQTSSVLKDKKGLAKEKYYTNNIILVLLTHEKLLVTKNLVEQG